MRKMLIILLVFPLFFFSAHQVVAEEYPTYQEIVFDSDDAMLLKASDDEMYETYYEALNKTRFIGWKIGVVNKNEPLEFISETKLRIENEGYSTIKYDVTLESSEETKMQISASGSVSVDIKGDIKKFKGTLDADIKASISYTTTSSQTEKYEFNIIVDPNTMVRIVTRGTGELSNGVAKYYFFWIEVKKGGWETFCVQTEYYEIIKEKIQ